MDLCRRMRVSTAKGAHDSVAHHSAVLIVCLQQQNNKLRGAAARHNVTLSQSPLNLDLQILHRTVQTPARQLVAFLVRNGQDSHVNRITAAGSGTVFRLIEKLEDTIIADRCAAQTAARAEALPCGCC